MASHADADDPGGQDGGGPAAESVDGERPLDTGAAGKRAEDAQAEAPAAKARARYAVGLVLLLLVVVIWVAAAELMEVRCTRRSATQR